MIRRLCLAVLVAVSGLSHDPDPTRSPTECASLTGTQWSAEEGATENLEAWAACIAGKKAPPL